MVIGLLQLDFHIPESHSLKGKRQVLKSLKDRIRQKFNVSVSEADHQDKWQLATLAVACVGTDQTHVNRTLNLLVEFSKREREAQLNDVQMEFL